MLSPQFRSIYFVGLAVKICILWFLGISKPSAKRQGSGFCNLSKSPRHIHIYQHCKGLFLKPAFWIKTVSVERLSSLKMTHGELLPTLPLSLLLLQRPRWWKNTNRDSDKKRHLQLTMNLYLQQARHTTSEQKPRRDTYLMWAWMKS